MVEIPHEGAMADLVWSDPISTPTFASEEKGDFAISPRGAGYIFGKEVTRKFLEVNGMGHICRAHQLCMEGYQVRRKPAVDMYTSYVAVVDLKFVVIDIV